MSFVLLCFPLRLRLGCTCGRTSAESGAALVATRVGVVAAVLVFGAARLAVTPREPMVRVGLDRIRL